MRKVIFIAGCGTAYGCHETGRDEIEVYPETLAALRFLERRNLILILATPSTKEYRQFLSSLKDKITLYHWDTNKVEIGEFRKLHGLVKNECIFITDGLYLKSFLHPGCKVLLVLSGRGLQTLASAQEEKEDKPFDDVAKDIYAAVFSALLWSP